MRLREVNHPAADLTATGVTLGTFDYISPEQARDPRNADLRSDLYSLGCTFFFMLTGRPPFPGGTVLQKLLQHQGDQPPDVRQFRPDLPDGVTRVLRKTLAKDPRHRYTDAAEMVADLLAVARQAGVRPWGPAGRSGGAAAAGGQVVAAALALGGAGGGPAGDCLGVGLFMVAVGRPGAAVAFATAHGARRASAAARSGRCNAKSLANDLPTKRDCRSRRRNARRAAPARWLAEAGPAWPRLPAGDAAGGPAKLDPWSRCGPASERRLARQATRGGAAGRWRNRRPCRG